MPVHSRLLSEGTLTAWNDERGFGFIRPDNGGPDVFVHVKAFPLNGERPFTSQRVAFEVEMGKEGKPRASYVEIVGYTPSYSHRIAPKSPPLSLLALSAIPAFLVLWVWVQLRWTLPVPVMFGYLLLSVVTFLAYARDKSAAQRGQWRISEASLQLLALAGGWPGAIMGQQFLRHKSGKRSFLGEFWLLVVVNIAVFLLLCSQQERVRSIFRELAPPGMWD